MKVTMDDVLTLIETVSDSNLTKFQFEDEDFSVSMASSKKRRKIKKLELSQEENKKVQENQIEKLYPEETVKKEEEEKEKETKEVSASLESKKEEEEKIICSPLVGTFYSAKEEGAEPFVKVGDTVKKGQVVGIVEAMKLMNEVESEYDGIVSEILVKNEEMVEYNQPLIRVAEK